MKGWLETWWHSLTEREQAGKLVLGLEKPPGFTRALAITVTCLYALYGASMGLFRGTYPAIVSGLKLPFMYMLTLALCLPPLYVMNCLMGPRLTVTQCLRLLLLATSANAAALASYAPFSYFFTLTTSREGYGFLVLMHVAVFAASGIVSFVVISLIFRATANELQKKLRLLFLLSWGLLYGFVGTQTSWVLRPWIGSWNVDYAPLRPVSGSFVESVWNLVSGIILQSGGQ